MQCNECNVMNEWIQYDESNLINTLWWMQCDKCNMMHFTECNAVNVMQLM